MILEGFKSTIPCQGKVVLAAMIAAVVQLRCTSMGPLENNTLKMSGLYWNIHRCLRFPRSLLHGLKRIYTSCLQSCVMYRTCLH